jgi:hypothetical protein
MKRRDFSAAALVAAAVPGWRWAEAAQANSDRDATLGVRAALERGAVAAVGMLGRSGGFLDDPRVRIPLPGMLDAVARMLSAIGQQAKVDALVTAMNRAAEAAVPEAKSLLVAAVRSMSLGDAQRIVGGGDNAATEFFAASTREPLAARFLPIVTRETGKVALAEKFDALAGQAAGFGLVRRQDANLPQYVTGKALDGLFLLIGEEERKIRSDPVGTGSAILGRVFGSR